MICSGGAGASTTRSREILFVLADHFEDDSALLDADDTIRSIRHWGELVRFVCFRIFVLATHEDERP